MDQESEWQRSKRRRSNRYGSKTIQLMKREAARSRNVAAHCQVPFGVLHQESTRATGTPAQKERRIVQTIQVAVDLNSLMLESMFPRIEYTGHGRQYWPAGTSPKRKPGTNASCTLPAGLVHLLHVCAAVVQYVPDIGLAVICSWNVRPDVCAGLYQFVYAALIHIRHRPAFRVGLFRLACVVFPTRTREEATFCILLQACLGRVGLEPMVVEKVLKDIRIYWTFAELHNQPPHIHPVHRIIDAVAVPVPVAALRAQGVQGSETPGVGVVRLGAEPSGPAPSLKATGRTLYLSWSCRDLKMYAARGIPTPYTMSAHPNILGYMM